MTKLATLALPALIASGAATQARGYTGQADCLVIVDGNLRDRRTLRIHPQHRYARLSLSRRQLVR